MFVLFLFGVCFVVDLMVCIVAVRWHLMSLCFGLLPMLWVCFVVFWLVALGFAAWVFWVGWVGGFC